MSSRNNRFASFYVAIICQNAINQLKKTENIDPVTLNELPLAEQSRRKKLLALTHPHIHSLERQQVIAWMLESYELLSFLKKQFFDLLAIAASEEIELFIEFHERIMQEQIKKQHLAWDQEAIVHEKDIKRIVGSLIAKIDNVIKELKVNIKQLNVDIHVLEQRQQYLLRNIEIKTHKIANTLVAIYRACAESADFKEVDVGGSLLKIYDSVIDVNYHLKRASELHLHRATNEFYSKKRMEADY